MKQVSRLITQKLETMASVPGTDLAFRSKHKAISSLLPYALHLARNEQRGMIDAISHVASNPKCWGFTWRHIGPYITTLFDESSPPYLNQVITLVTPSVRWVGSTYTPNMVARWTAAVLETKYSEAVGQNVVDALLQIAFKDTLRQEIPIDIWAWLKRRPSLPPVCRGRKLGATSVVVRYVRGLGDIEILKSYLLLVWSECDTPFGGGLTEMETIIREEFCGFAMRNHRKDLTDCLDHILGQLDQELGHKPVVESKKQRWGQLKRVLLEVDRSSTEASHCTPPKLTLFRSILTLVGAHRNLVEFPHQ